MEWTVASVKTTGALDVAETLDKSFHHYCSQFEDCKGCAYRDLAETYDCLALFASSRIKDLVKSIGKQETPAPAPTPASDDTDLTILRRACASYDKYLTELSDCFDCTSEGKIITGLSIAQIAFRKFMQTVLSNFTS